MDEASQAYGQMVRLVRTIGQAGAAELANDDLTPAQFGILVDLLQHPGRAQHQLAERFGVTRGNVSQLVKRLESVGLIERFRSAGTDEIHLTTEGRRLATRLVPAHREFLAGRFGVLEPAELAELGRLLGKLNRD